MTGSLMIQGTTSNAGKSVLVTGLCRLMHRNGIRVAPFKPQNMALNSAVTVDGGEIGRSQAVQAIAAGVEPHTDMNPVLLKPNTDQGAQVIINGRAIGNMDAREYHAFKPKALPHALAAYDRLMERYDLVVTEGAGSPAEINLRENDVANMGFALERNVPVIIVADIDRGGVFAHLKGTMDCLSAEERALVKGFVINRFRGDVSLLTSGNDWLEKETGVPVLGVLPYVHGLHIEAEDAVNTEQTGLADEGSILNVIVPRTPRISNHTDFDVLRLNPRVNLQFIHQGEDIPAADLVILPGSKSTIGDLKWLYSNGWKDYLLKHLRYGGRVIGICGGYQMLGNVIHDPDGIEGSPGSLEGLGFLDVETVLEPEKRLKRVSGTLNMDGAEVTGYEIHIGTTSGAGTETPLVDLGNHADGAVSTDGQVVGTYLHGLFDAVNAAESLMQWAGLDEFETADYDAIRAREFDRVADMLEAEISLETLKQCAGLT